MVLVVACNQRSVKSYVEEADQFVQAKKIDDALIVYQKGIQEHTKNSVLYLNQAALFRDKQKFESAIHNYQVVMTINPDTVLPYIGLARVYLMQKNTEAAKNILEKAVHQFLKNPYVDYFLGQTYVGLQDHAKALSYFTNAIDEKLPEAEVYYVRGCLYDEALHDKEKALADYEKYMSLGGKNSGEAFVRVSALKNSGFDF